MSTISNLTTTDAPLWETPENHGPLVSVITWFLVITAFLAMLARVSTRFTAVRQVRLDDVAIVVAMVKLCLQTRDENFADSTSSAVGHRTVRHHFSAGLQWSGTAHWLGLASRFVTI